MMLTELERLTLVGSDKWAPTDDFRTNYAKGADELELVRSASMTLCATRSRPCERDGMKTKGG